MPSNKRKLPTLAAFTVLLLFAFGVGCKGFFINSPTAVNITPNSVTLTQGQSQQLEAEATFGSGSPSNVTNSAVWSSSSACTVSVSTQTLGQVTAIGSGGAATITAIYNGVSGSATATAPSGVTISPCGTFTHGTTQQFSASFNGTDVTSSTTWTSSNSSIVSFASASSSLATFGPQTGTATIMAAGSATGFLEITVQ